MALDKYFYRTLPKDDKPREDIAVMKKRRLMTLFYSLFLGFFLGAGVLLIAFMTGSFLYSVIWAMFGTAIASYFLVAYLLGLVWIGISILKK